MAAFGEARPRVVNHVVRLHRVRGSLIAIIAIVLIATIASTPSRQVEAQRTAFDDKSTAAHRVVDANPGDYLDKLSTLKAGDTLRLAAGIYNGRPDRPGLPVFNLHGTPNARITITGPDDGTKATFIGTASHNTIRIANASHVVIRNLDIDGRNLGADGVNAQGVSHDITLENLTIRGVGNDQGTVAISTNRSPVWNWTIRGCTIVGAGTGMYLGSSDGSSPFVAGIIEHNVILDTLGYNVQIKHQVPWPSNIELPSGRTHTIIRHNVFSKRGNGSRGAGARPNLLVGDVPERGPGSDNGYEIYGNYFFQNPTEVLFQGEGNIAFYANVLINDFGGGMAIQRHNGHVRDVRVFGNTIIAASTGISITPGQTHHTQPIVANLVFAETPIVAPHQEANLLGRYNDALRDLVRARDDSGNVDVRLKAGAAGPVLDMHDFVSFSDGDRDFDGRPRDWRVRGAYSSDARASGRSLRLARKPLPETKR
ncbi:MAG TPA: hypothetical protein VNG69_05675 [Casimicrobiaceae bacterium]|nr:hypothetical protein [Casimicrobiaceae bacterium]